MDVLYTINDLAHFTDTEILETLRDGPRVPSNPCLQVRRDALRRRVLGLAARL